MKQEMKLSGFAKYAWFVLAYNVVVILWGVFLRASKSGDGCGQHWLTCHGEVVPSAPQLKTVIEFSHRIMSAVDGIFLIVLVVWAFFIWRSNKFASRHLLKAAIGSFVFVIIEGLIGAGLVLTGNTAETLTPARPFWTSAHLINTLILLAFLTLTAWFASGGEKISFRRKSKIAALLGLGVFGIFLIGVTGSIAALSSMLFPSATIAEGVAKDFSETSHILLRLRVSHPILSILVGVFLAFLASWIKTKAPENTSVRRWANALTILILMQFASGAITLLTLAPIVMQLVHLLLADAVWIAFVLMSAAVLAQINETENLSFTDETAKELK
jgi:heme A synthase